MVVQIKVVNEHAGKRKTRLKDLSKRIQRINFSYYAISVNYTGMNECRK